MTTRRGCRRVQKYLVNYLNIGLDPYDFPQDFLLEWATDAGIELDQNDASCADLSPQQLKGYEAWLREHDKAGQIMEEDPYGSPAYLMLDQAVALPPKTWCVHFTNADVFRAFDRGATLEGLHLSTWKREKTFVDCDRNMVLEQVGPFEIVWGFAFEASMFEGWVKSDNYRVKSRKYGKNAILFQTDCAVRAWHHGDEEWQVIFPLCSERNLVPFVMEYDGQQRETVRVEGDDGQEITEPSLKALIARIEREAEAKEVAKLRRKRSARAR